MHVFSQFSYIICTAWPVTTYSTRNPVQMVRNKVHRIYGLMQHMRTQMAKHIDIRHGFGVIKDLTHSRAGALRQSRQIVGVFFAALRPQRRPLRHESFETLSSILEVVMNVFVRRNMVRRMALVGQHGL